MREIDILRDRLERPIHSADGLAGALEPAWEAFDLLLATCHACEDRSAELFAAFAFGSAAAAQGRHLIWAAPSLPPTSGTGTSGAALVMDNDLEEVADALAGLAQALGRCLSSAARVADDPGDKGACADAAREADEIRQLLNRDP